MPHARRSRSRRTAAEWQVLIQRYAQGDLTLRAFCAQEGVAESTFTAWRRRLQAAAVAPKPPEVAEPAPSAPEPAGGLFAELSLPGSPSTDAPGQGEQDTPPWEVEVELDLGAGVCLRIRRVPGC
ncbi:IS66 family insertion sequence element accessory protein TnpB [Halorhodospira sp. 9621]|uniref:IS66 family insertion sequence element accessory protein TnpA n=1 Tax=Halorhodospira sp. 9621 TaxID=2899135 RepID=UPI001EE89EE2|nr:IS66 family insertion sequence element accessory protein TnpB [Halorhodospira sp. 9621]MCG5534356.1 IS66 family insertion sequence element accessory protein TnpB [Halorhodospira sp. 9621]